MPPVRSTRPGLVRPQFGPGLPALLRARFGIPERLTPVLLVAVVALLVLAGLALRGDDGVTELVHRDAPAYTLLYAGALEEKRPRAGELTRLETTSRRVRAAVVVRPFRLPTGRRGAIYAEAPIVMARRIDALRRGAAGFELREDARTRVNTAPGYEIAYRTGTPGRPALTRQVVLVEDEETQAGVELTLRYTRPPKLRAADRRVVGAVRSAYRSFRFGTDRP